MSKHGEFLQAMLEYAEARGLQVKQVGIAFRGKRPDYCIVDDDLQPYDLQPTESTNMQSLKRASLVAAIMGMLPSMAHSYSHPIQIQPEPNFSPSPSTSSSKRKHLSPTKGGSHKQNLRASKRGGKQYKQVKS